VSLSTGRVPSPTRRRGTALVLALSLGLLSACGQDGADTPETAAAPPAASEEASPAPASPTESTPTESTPTESAPAETQGGTVAVSAEDFTYALDQESLAAGEYTFELTNDGDASHDLVIERDGEDVAATEVIRPGATASVTVALEPGEYVFYCSVGNHRAMGMEVPVTVTG